MKKLLIFIIVGLIVLNGCASGSSDFSHLDKEDQIIYDDLYYLYEVVSEYASDPDNFMLEGNDRKKFNDVFDKFNDGSLYGNLTRNQKDILSNLDTALYFLAGDKPLTELAQDKLDETYIIFEVVKNLK